MSTQPERSAPRTSESSNPTGSGAGIRGRFPRAAKLLRHGDYQRVYQQGRRQFAPHMTFFYLERPSGAPRVGLTVGRVLGGAVQRNRIKRRMREAVRANLGSITAPVDVVINPKKSVLTLEFAALREEVGRALALVQEKVGSPESPAARQEPRARNSAIGSRDSGPGTRDSHRRTGSREKER